MKLKRTRSLLLPLLCWLPADPAAAEGPHAAHPPSVNRFATMSDAESRAAVDSARAWARTLAGDDPARYAAELQDALLRIKSGGTQAEAEAPAAAPGPGAVMVAVKSGREIRLFDPAAAPEAAHESTLTGLSPERRRELTDAARTFIDVLDASPHSPTPELLTLLARAQLAREATGPGGPSIALVPKAPPGMTFEDWTRPDPFRDGGRDAPIGRGAALLGPEGRDRTGMAGGLGPSAGGRVFRDDLPASTWSHLGGAGHRESFDGRAILSSGGDIMPVVGMGPDRLGQFIEANRLTRDQQSVMMVDRSTRSPTWNSLLASDEKWQQNFDRWLELPTPPYPGARILGSQYDEADLFPYCVAISDSDRIGDELGSGVLISPNVVLTAAHVVPEDRYRANPAFRQTVWVGRDSNSATRRVKAKAAKRHPDYVPDAATNTFANDIGLLILEERVDLPRLAEFASAAEVDAAPALVIVGYGMDRTGDFGYRQFGTVYVGTTDSRRYGCFDYELVAGARSVDACHGDSGGGCFVPCLDGQGRLCYKLGAVVSRSYRGGANCGSGGIKVRVDRKFVGDGMQPGGWAREWILQNGGLLPGS